MASPRGKEIGREWGLRAGGLREKSEILLPSVRLWPAVPVYFVHSVVSRGFTSLPVFCIVVGVGRF